MGTNQQVSVTVARRSVEPKERCDSALADHLFFEILNVPPWCNG